MNKDRDVKRDKAKIKKEIVESKRDLKSAQFIHGKITKTS